MENKLNIDDRAEIFRALLQILNNWNVPASAQIQLLGLPETTRPRSLQHYKMGQDIPNEKDFVSRAHYLISINNAVSTFYPHNLDAANFWVTTDNFYFGGQSPLDIMLNNGVEGMSRVLGHLNGDYQA